MFTTHFPKVFLVRLTYDPQVIVSQEPEGLSHVPLPDCPRELVRLLRVRQVQMVLLVRIEL